MGKFSFCATCACQIDGSPSGLLRHQATAKHKAKLVEKFAAVEPAVEAAAWMTTESPPRPEVHIGGFPRSSEEKEAARKWDQTKLALREAEKALAKAQHDLDYRNKLKHLHQFGERSRQNFRDQIAKLTDEVASLTADREAYETLAAGYEMARHEVDYAMFEALELYVSNRFSSNSFLQVKGNGRGDFRVQWLTGKVKEATSEDGTPYEYPEVAFGFEATVYGPELSYGHVSGTPQTKEAHVGWGSMQMDDIAEAERMLTVFQTSIEVAKLINAIYGVAS